MRYRRLFPPPVLFLGLPFLAACHVNEAEREQAVRDAERTAEHAATESALDRAAVKEEAKEQGRELQRGASDLATEVAVGAKAVGKQVGEAASQAVATAGDAVDEVVARVGTKADCADICGRYNDCFDSSYDTAACAKTCEARVRGSETAQSARAALDSCDACYDQWSCLEARERCSEPCRDVVP